MIDSVELRLEQQDLLFSELPTYATGWESWLYELAYDSTPQVIKQVELSEAINILHSWGVHITTVKEVK